ncbi:MAG: DUF4115 domain-containing protein [Bacillota bacterium]|nr:DUF4115 domain-containing protein [Bacillota bacterium]
MESVGTILRQRREELGLSLEEVQARTKIRSRYLDALERGDYGLLPGEVYVRGFLRAYGEAMGLDPQMLLERYQREVGSTSEEAPAPPASGQAGAGAGGGTVVEGEPEAGPAPPPQAGGVLPPRARSAASRPGRSGAPARGARGPARGSRAVRPASPAVGLRSPRRFLAVLLGAVLVVGVLAYALWPRSPAASPAAGRKTPPVTQTGQAGQDTSGKGAGGGSGSQAPGGSGATLPAVEKSVSGQTVLYTLKEKGPLRLDAAFTDRVWLEVKTDGKLAFSGIVLQGARRSWSAASEIDIVTARPYAMDLTLNGQALGVPSPSTVRTYLVFVLAGQSGGGSGATGTGGSGAGQGSGSGT